MTKDEALKWALEALEGFYEYGYDRLECFEYITAIKEALAQPEHTNTRPWYTIDELSEWIDKYQNQEWRNAAIMLGEKLSSVGPDGYYNMEAKDWLDWAMENVKLAQPEQDNTYIYASSLATAIWQKHYMKESPKFALLDTTEGVLTQIDNMTCGLVREKPAQSEQEPVAWTRKLFSPEIGEWFDYKDGAFAREADSKGWTPLYTSPPQRTWVGLTDEERKDTLQSVNTGFVVDASVVAIAIEAKLKEKNT